MNKAMFFATVVALLGVLNSCSPDKSVVLLNDWKATELTLGETTLKAEDLGGVSFSFKPDKSFVYSESGNKEEGKWELSESGAEITLTYKEGNRKVTQRVIELSDEKLIVSFEDHGMQRKIQFVPESK